MGAAPLCKNLGHRLYLRKYHSQKVQNFTSTQVVSNTLFGCENFSDRGRVKGAAPPNVNLGPNHIFETIRAGKLKFYMQLGRVKYSYWDVKISRKGRPRDAAPHSVNWGPPSYVGNCQSQKFEILRTFRQGQVHFSSVNFFRQGRVRAQDPLLYIWDSLISRKLLEPES